MATPEVDVDRMRNRMRRIRSRMHTKVDVLREDAESLGEWRYYVRHFPATTLASVALLAFWLTPGHRVASKVRLDDRSIEKLIERGGVHIETVQKAPEGRSSSWWNSLLRSGVSLGGRILLAQLGQQLMQHATEEVATSQEY